MKNLINDIRTSIDIWLLQTKINDNKCKIISICHYACLILCNGVCLSWRIMERIRETSLLVLLDLGLKSHNLAMRSHSVPGSIAPVSATNCFSAFLN